MWVAFALAAVFVVFFVQRVTRALSDRERELQIARAQGERREKLASLATLAAGAAHELSTPLSTIAVVAKELLRSLSPSVSNEVRADLQLVRDQVGRCREILDRMAAHAGENFGEPLATASVREWGRVARRSPERTASWWRRRKRGASLVGPPRALARPAGLQECVAGFGRGLERISVARRTIGSRRPSRLRTRNAGMPEAHREPFFTTKGPGRIGRALLTRVPPSSSAGAHIASAPAPGPRHGSICRRRTPPRGASHDERRSHP
jgi:two-component system sensor histidine kinase RegB